MASIQTVKMTRIELDGKGVTLPFEAGNKDAGEPVKARIVFETPEGDLTMPIDVLEFRMVGKKIAKVIIKTEA